MIESVDDDSTAPFVIRNFLIIGQVTKRVARREMSRFQQRFAQSKTVPEIRIGGIGNSGIGPDQKEEIDPEKESYPGRGHRNSAT